MPIERSVQSEIQTFVLESRYRRRLEDKSGLAARPFMQSTWIACIRSKMGMVETKKKEQPLTF